MKTKFSNDMCAHVWAQQSQPFGESNSMHFDGAVIYSYRTPIAAFVPTVNGEKGTIALVTSEKYSSTTSSKHIPAVHAAIRGKYFNVPDIGHSGGRTDTVRTDFASNPKSWRKVHAVNLAFLAEAYRKNVARMLRVQSWNFHGIDGAMSEISGPAKTLQEYAAAFGIKKIPTIDVAADAARILERTTRLDAERAHPDYAAKRDAAATRREELQQEKRERAQRERTEKAAADIAKWREGEYVQGFRFTLPDGSALLRVNGDSVETSQGANAPLKHAQRAFRFADAMRKRCNGEPSWTRSESEDGSAEYTLGHFTLDRIDASGVRIGCHFIAWTEIDAIRASLEVTP